MSRVFVGPVEESKQSAGEGFEDLLEATSRPDRQQISLEEPHRGWIPRGAVFYVAVPHNERACRFLKIVTREEVENLFRACPSLRQTLGCLPEHNRLFQASSSELHQEAGCNLSELPRHL